MSRPSLPSSGWAVCWGWGWLIEARILGNHQQGILTKGWMNIPKYTNFLTITPFFKWSKKVAISQNVFKPMLRNNSRSKKRWNLKPLMEIQSYFITKKGQVCWTIWGFSRTARTQRHPFILAWLEVRAQVGNYSSTPHWITTQSPQKNISTVQRLFLIWKSFNLNHCRVTKYVISVVAEPLQLCYLPQAISTVNNLQIFSQLCAFKPSNWSGTFGKLQVPSSSKVTRTPHKQSRWHHS